MLSHHQRPGSSLHRRSSHFEAGDSNPGDRMSTFVAYTDL